MRSGGVKSLFSLSSQIFNALQVRKAKAAAMLLIFYSVECNGLHLPRATRKKVE
jgi:hypothetical protein